MRLLLWLANRVENYTPTAAAIWVAGHRSRASIPWNQPSPGACSARCLATIGVQLRQINLAEKCKIARRGLGAQKVGVLRHGTADRRKMADKIRADMLWRRSRLPLSLNLSQHTPQMEAVNRASVKASTKYLRDDSIFLVPSEIRGLGSATARCAIDVQMSGKLPFGRRNSHPWPIMPGSGLLPVDRDRQSSGHDRGFRPSLVPAPRLSPFPRLC